MRHFSSLAAVTTLVIVVIICAVASAVLAQLSGETKLQIIKTVSSGSSGIGELAVTDSAQSVALFGTGANLQVYNWNLDLQKEIVASVTNFKTGVVYSSSAAVDIAVVASWSVTTFVFIQLTSPYTIVATLAHTGGSSYARMRTSAYCGSGSATLGLFATENSPAQIVLIDLESKSVVDETSTGRQFASAAYIADKKIVLLAAAATSKLYKVPIVHATKKMGTITTLTLPLSSPSVLVQDPGAGSGYIYVGCSNGIVRVALTLSTTPDVEDTITTAATGWSAGAAIRSNSSATSAYILFGNRQPSDTTFLKLKITASGSWTVLGETKTSRSNFATACVSKETTQSALCGFWTSKHIAKLEWFSSIAADGSGHKAETSAPATTPSPPDEEDSLGLVLGIVLPVCFVFLVGLIFCTWKRLSDLRAAAEAGSDKDGKEDKKGADPNAPPNTKQQYELVEVVPAGGAPVAAAYPPSSPGAGFYPPPSEPAAAAAASSAPPPALPPTSSGIFGSPQQQYGVNIN